MGFLHLHAYAEDLKHVGRCRESLGIKVRKYVGTGYLAHKVRIVYEWVEEIGALDEVDAGDGGGGYAAVHPGGWFRVGD